MGKCSRHPDVDAEFHCQKHQVYQCRLCLACRDPELYCRYRSACPIVFLERSGEIWDTELSADPPEID